MSNPTVDFVAEVKRECARIGRRPIEVLQAAGVHKSMWARWEGQKCSPTLSKVHAVRVALKEMAKSSKGRAA